MPTSTRNIVRTDPLRVMFFTTSMPVGGAETLLTNLIRRFDRGRIAPELCCLKQPGPLGEELACEIPVYSDFTRHKLDVRVLWRLKALIRERRIDAVVTVGAGDKMFWGRLAARLAGVPVVCSALHSTGWPDGVGRLNRLLTPLTDAFIGVAVPHGRHLVERERFPAEKVVVIPNGVDTDRFSPGSSTARLRTELGVGPAAPVATIVAALRPEKNHDLFLQVASLVLRDVDDARFLIVGDGAERARLEARSEALGLGGAVLFLGTRSDIPALLNATDVNVLTSHNEANPVSILEAMSTATPTVATNVGSVAESVIDGKTGYLAPPGDADRLAERVVELFSDPLTRRQMGDAARELVLEKWSLDVMVRGYEDLLTQLYTKNTGRKFEGPVVEVPSGLPEQAAEPVLV